MAQKENSTANALMDQILNGNKQGDQGEQAIQMPELALRCAQFFHSLSQYCLYFYKNYNREADIHKTKLIKKLDKSKKNKYENAKRNHNEQKKARALRGQVEPEPPKKPLTAYILYFQDKKPSFSQKFPSLSLSELTKLIAKDWKDLKQDEKKPYLDKAADDRKRYQTEINEFKRKYRLGDGGRQETEFITEQNKGSQVLEQKEQQILIQIQEQIKAISSQNQGDLQKSQRQQQQQQNLDEGVNDDDEDDDQNVDQDENNEDSQNIQVEEIDDDIQNQASEQAKIQEEQ